MLKKKDDTIEKHLGNIKDILKGKDIIVLNTKKDKLKFAMAHIFRNYARVTFCIDPTYDIKENPFGFRELEDGRVFLIKGDWTYDRSLLENKIKLLGGKPKYVF